MPPDVYRSAQFCRFYDAGYCRNGNSCRFKHDPQHFLLVAVDPNGINTPPAVTMHEASYMSTPYIFPYIPPSAMSSPICYQVPFGLYDSYPQYSPPLPPPSQYHPADWYPQNLQPNYVSRSSSMDSSSITSSLVTVSESSQCIPEGNVREPVAEGANHPEYVTSPDHCSNSALFRGSSGIAKAKPQEIQATTKIDTNKPKSNSSQPRLHSKPYNERKPSKTVRCKFHKPPKKLCPKGDNCTFIHSDPSPLTNAKGVSWEVESSGSQKNNSVSPKKDTDSKLPSPGHTLPAKPLTYFEAEREKGFFAVTWRVISGGVQMGVNQPDSGIKHSSRAPDRKNLVLKTPAPAFPNAETDPRPRSPAQSLNRSNPAKIDRPPRKRTLSSPSRPGPAPALQSANVFLAESP
ncbi:hypothetical protein GGU10DRAFT_378090 [Lentinula aff. detonsa]|uniref:C3H1-type domain-containing protein n=1 Tax=Lentinula aff. detonsa TaxID=2804958 RepID=A0AA38KME4_9AGAR|nr:hypothetical protein GGU10DRAFT_378090 [Lentinula aff. detonsa]